MQVSYQPVGNVAVNVAFGNEVDEEINAQVMALGAAVQRAKLPGVGECVPTYAALLVHYDPLVTGYAAVAAALEGLRQKSAAGQLAAQPGKLVELPVCYGGTYGEDLPFVASHAGLSEEEVIKRHCGRAYRIFMLGFLPGFPYLGGMDEALFTPRLENPRVKIPAGSVGIGGKQTGVYPLDSPGGWQLIGRTPYKLFDPEKGGKLPYAAGDRIRFVPITSAVFAEIEAGKGWRR